MLAIKLNGFKTLKEFEDTVLRNKDNKPKIKSLSNLNSFKERITKRKTTYKYANEENFKLQLGPKESYILSEEELRNLNRKELKLCQDLNISPEDFFLVKECLI